MRFATNLSNLACLMRIWLKTKIFFFSLIEEDWVKTFTAPFGLPTSVQVEDQRCSDDGFLLGHRSTCVSSLLSRLQNITGSGKGRLLSLGEAENGRTCLFLRETYHGIGIQHGPPTAALSASLLRAPGFDWLSAARNPLLDFKTSQAFPTPFIWLIVFLSLIRPFSSLYMSHHSNFCL